MLIMKKYIETDGCMMASATDKQKDSLKEYMKKIKDIKLRVPEEYLQPIKEHAKAKGMSVNQLVISLLEKNMGIEIVTVREQNKQNKENENE
ncbi:MAG: BrnA antitoxin family protein [Lachnospiraceae bacterium]|mgnify:FL=1|nr:MAG: BrnA antitoxin family protein [Lachnospiraceae bacterium]